MTVTIPAGTPASAGLAVCAQPCVTAGAEATNLYLAIGGHAALVAAVCGHGDPAPGWQPVLSAR